MEGWVCPDLFTFFMPFPIIRNKILFFFLQIGTGLNIFSVVGSAVSFAETSSHDTSLENQLPGIESLIKTYRNSLSAVDAKINSNLLSELCTIVSKKILN